MEMRYKLQAALEKASAVIQETNRDYAEVFGRDHGGLHWEYLTEDAEVYLVGMGSMASEATTAADMLREEGIKAGVVGVRVFRPFPAQALREAFQKARGIVIFEKGISYGYEGALCSDLKAALYRAERQAPIHNYIAGLGGRDVKAREIADAARASWQAMEKGIFEQPTSWLNCFTG